MINVWIDVLTPCLKDKKTGEIVPTEVIRIRRKSFLKKYNRANFWYTNWDKLLDETEVYALVVEGTVDIQGLIAIEKDDELKALYVAWMCASPVNNKELTSTVKYEGVGGHLFAVAARKSFEYGYNGCIYGFAANKKLEKHYINMFHAEHIGILHPYQFMIDEANSSKLVEVYDYGWTDEEI